MALSRPALAAAGALALTLTTAVFPAQAEEGVGVWATGHVQGIGWMPASTDMVGTTGQGLRLEAVALVDPIAEIRGHVQGVGWQEWSTDRAGTSGQGLRLEAVQIAGRFGNTIRCQAHVEGIGWMPPVSDGEICGTTGQGLRLEALRFWLEPHPAAEG